MGAFTAEYLILDWLGIGRGISNLYSTLLLFISCRNLTLMGVFFIDFGSFDAGELYMVPVSSNWRDDQIHFCVDAGCSDEEEFE